MNWLAFHSVLLCIMYIEYHYLRICSMEKHPTPPSSNLENYQQKAVELYKQGNFAKCVEMCDTAIEHGKKGGTIYNTKAIALAQLQKYNLATAAINVAIELEEDNKTYAKNKRIIKEKLDQIGKQIYMLNGTDGILHLFSDRVLLNRSSRLFPGKKNDREILLSEISEIQIKPPGSMSGYIRFILKHENKDSEQLSAHKDENSVQFLKDDLDTAQKIQAKIKDIQGL